MFTHSKDPQVFDRQLEQKSLLLKADLVAQTSEASSIVSISGLIAARTISIDVKEEVKSVQKVQVVNRANGSNAGISAAPSVSGSVISVTLDATGLSDVCIVVDYRN